jgi:hypothetical protein
METEKKKFSFQEAHSDMPNTHPKTAGLAMHGATVALTPARAVTSHLRKRYHERYHGRYKYAPLIFAFDLAVFGIAATLVAINIYLFLAVPAQKPSLGLLFQTAPIVTAAPQALVATVEARGADSKGRVSLKWNLPAGTEILSAEPALNSSNETELGSLKAGERASSRLIVRFFAPRGTLRLGFNVIDSDRMLTGYENRQVESSALILEPLFPNAALKDGRIPLRITNQSNQTLEGITLAGTDQVGIDKLEPDQDAIVFAGAGHVSALMRAYPLVERDLSPRSSVDESAIVKLQPSTGNTARLDVEVAVAGRVNVYHPGIAHPHTRTFEVPAGKTTLTVPLDRPADDAAWYAVASTARGNGVIAESKITTPFDVSAAVRYYASTGDQIGVGPLPPQVGQETRYWLQVAIGQTRSDLSDVRVRIRLPDGVKHTGRDALPSGGGLSESGDEIIWRLPYLAASPEGAQVRLELALTPEASMIGKTALLVESIQATATEVVSGITLDMSVDGLDTSLPEDNRAKGKAIVE